MISGAHFHTNTNKLKQGFLPILSLKLTFFFNFKKGKRIFYFILIFPNVCFARLITPLQLQTDSDWIGCWEFGSCLPNFFLFFYYTSFQFIIFPKPFSKVSTLQNLKRKYKYKQSSSFVLTLIEVWWFFSKFFNFLCVWWMWSIDFLHVFLINN
jgi:hypothetical protein